MASSLITRVSGLYAVLVFLATAASLNSAEFAKPNAWPKVTITNISFSTNANHAAEVSFDIAAMGEGPVGITEGQLSIEFSKRGWLLRAALSTTNGSSAVLLAYPGRPLSIKATVIYGKTERKDEGLANLPSGECTAQIFINSGRIRQFPYQWLGQISSKTYVFEIRPP